MALFQQSVLNNYLSGIHEQRVNGAERMDYFNQQKARGVDLKSQIAKTDAEIDGMVYELYGLTGEIAVVEGSV